MSYRNKKYYLGEWLVSPLSNQISNKNKKKEVVPKLMETLCFLADHHSQVVSADLIVEAIWQKTVVGDNSLYNNIAQLRKLLEDTERKKHYIETIPKKGYRLIAPLRDYHKIEKASEDDVSLSSISNKVKKASLLVATALALSLATTLVLLNTPDKDVPVHVLPSMTTIAVLPFDTPQNHESTTYFSQGISDSMAHRLSQIPGLKVISKSTSEIVKKDNASLTQLNKKLGIGTVLTGSVQKHNQNIRVIVQLINTEDGRILWSNTFNKKLDDIFQIQDEITQATADTLKLNLVSSSRPLDVSAKAYDYYLMGRFLWNRRNPEDTQRAINYFQKAIEISPNYALAYIGLSDAYIFQYEYGNLSRDKAYKEAQYNIKRALELDSQLAEPYTSLGLIAMNLGDYNKAEELFNQAIDFNPNYSTAYHWYGLLLNNMGQHEKALKLQQYVLSIDPLSAIVHRNVAFSYLLSGNREKALEYFETSLEIGSNLFGTAFLKLNIYPLNQQAAEQIIRFIIKNYATIPETVPHKITLALLSLTADTDSKAKIFIEQSKVLVPDHPRITDALIALHAAHYDWEKVIDLLNNKLQRQPLNQSVKVELAYAYYFAQRYDLLQDHLKEYGHSLKGNWRIYLLANMNAAFTSSQLTETVPTITIEPLEEVALLINNNQLDEATNKLHQYVKQGYIDDFSQRWWTIENDPLFESIRDSDDFKSLVNELRRNKAILKALYLKVPTSSSIIKTAKN